MYNTMPKPIMIKFHNVTRDTLGERLHEILDEYLQDISDPGLFAIATHPNYIEVSWTDSRSMLRTHVLSNEQNVLDFERATRLGQANLFQQVYYERVEEFFTGAIKLYIFGDDVVAAFVAEGWQDCLQECIDMAGLKVCLYGCYPMI